MLKRRERQSGSRQYERQATEGRFQEVNEGGVKLLVNLTDYLDTGLFLDHRPMRMRIQREAEGKRFLNLFCYTATASVHAAKGGARSTTSVDLSKTYLDWARRNLALNGFSERNRLEQGDVMAWLQNATDSYDMIFIDPPTFSNSKRMEGCSTCNVTMSSCWTWPWPVWRRGRAVFLQQFPQVPARRAPGGALRGGGDQRPDPDPDFARNNRIHRAWQLRLR